MEAKNNIEIDASSMADIAFLLLVFFLVTTTMVPDQGITVRLPEWIETKNEFKITPRNVFAVLMNGNNELQVRGEEMPIELLRSKTKEFVLNPNRLMSMADKPNKALISLKNDRATSYAKYLWVYNEIKAAYSELWEEEAQLLHNIGYQYLTKVQQKSIRNKFPLILSEAEASDFGESE